MFVLLIIVGLLCLRNAMSSLSTGTIYVELDSFDRHTSPKTYWFMFVVTVLVGCSLLHLAYWDFRLMYWSA